MTVAFQDTAPIGAANGIFNEDMLKRLSRQPEAQLRGEYRGVGFTAKIALPYMPARIAKHYETLLAGESLSGLAQRLGTAQAFDQFGLICVFDTLVNLPAFGEDMCLAEDVRLAEDAFGPLMLRNASADTPGVPAPQTNIFSHLKFHFDRGETQPERYSLFLRDARCPTQNAPRGSGTIIVPNIVAYLQALKETGSTQDAMGMLKASRKLFEAEDLRPLRGEIMFEQTWDAPAGTSEVTILDNRTVFHASCYPDAKTPGYPIGVRYLA